MAVVAGTMTEGGAGSEPGGNAIQMTHINDGTFLVITVGFDSTSSTHTAGPVYYNAVEMTQLFDDEITQARLAVYYLVNPSSGSNTLTVNFVGGLPSNRRVAAHSFSGIDPLDPIGGTATAQEENSTTTIEATVTVEGASGIIFSSFMSSRVSSGASTSPHTDVTNQPWTGGVDYTHIAGYGDHTGSDVAVEYDNFTGLLSNSRKIMYAVELIASPFIPNVQIV